MIRNGCSLPARILPGKALVALAGMAATMLLGIPLMLHPVPRLVWNASASAPIGFYLVRSAGSLHRGDLVLMPPPGAVARLASARGYLPDGVLLVKRAAALSGDLVCVNDKEVRLNGHHVAWTLPEDREGRPLPWWDDCRRLVDDEVFLLMPDVPDSFDSRYFGPVPSNRIVGRLVPLWTR